MAFFKFRLPSQKASSLPEATAPSPAESLEVVRQKARFRLIGAAVLVLVAVVGFPLVFDTQPRPVPVDTPIVIPDRQATPGLTTAAPAPAQLPAKPLSVGSAAAASASSAASAASASAETAAAPVAAHAALDPKEEIVKPQESASAVQASAALASSQASATAKTPAASGPAPATRPAQTPPATKADTGHKDDSARAKALLEGHSKADAAAGDRHIIQVGAYSDPDKLREVRRKLENAGLKTYTQVVDGKDGKRTTRVRIGPFESRGEAEKTAARIRKLDLPANLIKL